MKAVGARFLTALGSGDIADALRYTTAEYQASRSLEAHRTHLAQLGLVGNKGFGAERYSALGPGRLRFVVIGDQGQPVPVLLRFARRADGRRDVADVTPYDRAVTR